jgi:ParB-like chromosome segregation protein Spo0J
MSANNLEKFDMRVVKRSEIHGAPYNPRQISDDARRKLRADLKKFGILGPIIVNARSMNIVSGHQRVDAMDQLMRKPDYELTVAFVDLDDRAEVEANVLLNNQAVMGDWDTSKLAELKLAFPDLDFQKDLGFDQVDLDVMFSGLDDMAELAPMFQSRAVPEEEDELTRMQKADKYKEAKKKLRKGMAEAGENGDTYSVEHDDYSLTFVFNNNREKHDFMMHIKKAQGEKYLRASVLFDIFDGKYDLRAPLSLTRDIIKQEESDAS